MQLEVEQKTTGLHRLPWVTLALVVACGCVLAFSETNPRLQNTSFAAWGVIPSDFAPLKALTHVFFHAHTAHLLGTIALLLLVGVPLEARWSAIFFLPLLAAGAMASGSAYAWRSAESSLPMVGMAGVIAAILGASLVRFRRGFPVTWYRVNADGLQAAELTLPVLVLLPVWFLGEVAGSIGHYDAVTRGISYSGQLAGLCCGALIAGLLEFTGLERRVFGAFQAGDQGGPHPAIESALHAREMGDLNEALSILSDAVAGGVNDPNLVVHFWEMASFAGKPQLAAEPFQRLIEKELASGDSEAARKHWLELVQRVRDVDAPPRLLLQLVPLLLSADHKKEAVLTLQVAVRSPELTPGMALRVVDLAGELDPPSTLRAARLALTSTDLHETKRLRLSTLTRDLNLKGVRELEVEPPIDEVALNRVSRDAGADHSLELAEDDFEPPVVASAAHSSPSEGFALSADGSRVGGAIDGDLAGSDPNETTLELDPVNPLYAETSPEGSSDPDGLHLEDVPATSGLALHGLDLEAEELSAAASLVDEMPSTGVDLDVPGIGAYLPYSTEEDGEPRNALDAIALDSAYDEPRFSDAKVVEAVPVELEATRLRLQQAGGRKGYVEFRKVDAVSVATVHGMTAEPVVLLDLLANWTSLEGGVLRIIRVRGDRFDARRLMPDAADRLEAFKMLTQFLIEQCGAVAIPDPLAAVGQPYRVCEQLTDYERDILLIDR